MEERGKRITIAVLTGTIVITHSVGAFLALRGIDRYSDEGHHLRQISSFCAGEFSLDPKLTTIPGYHALLALLGRVLGDCSLSTLRGLNVALGLLLVIGFAFALRSAGSNRIGLRTLQLYFLPILLPYHFLIYTDVASLAAVLVTVACFMTGRRWAAGIAGAASILLRQTNVVWLFFLWAQSLIERRERHAYRPLLPGLLVFSVFVAANGGIALGDQRAHQIGLYTGNVFFFLFLFFVLFLPHNLSVLWSNRRRLADLRLHALLTASYLIFLFTFGLEHAYNRFPGFLHNELLLALEAHPLLKTAFFVPVAGAIVVLFVERLRRSATFPLLGAALLSLAPAKLIEHRYSLPLLALFLALREDDSDLVEALGLGQSVVLSTFLLDGLARGTLAL